MRRLLGFARYCRLWAIHAGFRSHLVYLDAGAAIRIEPSASVQIGTGLRILRDFTAQVAGRLSIGDAVFFNRGCHLVALERVEIGSNCLFGEGVSIHDEEHIPARGAVPPAARGFRTAPVIIGRNVWVGAKVTITAGVRIGDNAVIGANAVVTHDIPPDCVAAGVPARVVRTL